MTDQQQPGYGFAYAAWLIAMKMPSHPIFYTWSQLQANKLSARCKHCNQAIQLFKERWWVGNDFQCADGENNHEPA